MSPAEIAHGAPFQMSAPNAVRSVSPIDIALRNEDSQEVDLCLAYEEIDPGAFPIHLLPS
jgi:hypothetical protein